MGAFKDQLRNRQHQEIKTVIKFQDLFFSSTKCGTCAVKLDIKEQVLEIGMNPRSLLIIKRIIVDTDKRYRKNIRKNNGGHVSFKYFSILSI